MANYPSIPISFGFEQEPPDYGTIRTEYEDGYVQTRAKSTVGARLFRLSHEMVTAAEVATFDAFWRAHKGGSLAFTFTDPRTSEAMQCVFHGPKPRYRHIGPTTYSIEQFEIEEKL